MAICPTSHLGALTFRPRSVHKTRPSGTTYEKAQAEVTLFCLENDSIKPLLRDITSLTLTNWFGEPETEN